MRTLGGGWALLGRPAAWASPVPALLLLIGLLAAALAGWQLASARSGLALTTAPLTPDATGRVRLPLPPEATGSSGILAVRVRLAPESTEPGWLILEGDGRASPEEGRRRLLPGMNRLLWELPEGVGAGGLTVRSLSPDAPWQLEAAHLFPGVGPGVLAPLGGLVLALGLGLASLVVAVARARRGWRSRWAGALAIVLGVGAGLRLYSLDAQGFWLDEVLTLIGAQSLTWLLYTPQIFEHPPLHYLLVWAVRFFADTEAAIRLPFVALGVASLWATAWLGRVLMGPGVGVVAAALLALAPFHVNASQTARPYALVVFLAAVALAALWRALETNRLLAWLGFVAAGSLLCYTHYFGLLVVALAALVCLGRPCRWRESALALAAIGLLYAPWLPIARRQWWLQQSAGTVTPADLGGFVQTLLLPDLAGDHRLSWVGLAAAGVGLAASWRRPRLLALFLLWIAGPLLAIWLLQPAHFLLSRHLIFLLPVLACLVARGVVVLGGWAGTGLLRLVPGLPGWSLGWRAPRWSRIAAVTAVFLLTTAPSVSGLQSYYEIRRGPDWREVARVLRQVVQEGDRVEVTEGAYYPLRHYYGAQVSGLNLAALRRVVRRAPADQQIWVLYQEEAETAPALTAWLDRHGELIQTFPSSWSLKESRLYLIRRGPGKAR